MNPKTNKPLISLSSRLSALFNCNTNGRFCVFCVVLALIAIGHGFHVAQEVSSSMKSITKSTENILDRVNDLEKFTIKQNVEPLTGTPTLAPPLNLPNIPTVQQYKYHASPNEKIIGSGNPDAGSTGTGNAVPPAPVTTTNDPEDDPS